jgi:hypothetical protein
MSNKTPPPSKPGGRPDGSRPGRSSPERSATEKVETSKLQEYWAQEVQNLWSKPGEPRANRTRQRTSEPAHEEGPWDEDTGAEGRFLYDDKTPPIGSQEDVIIDYENIEEVPSIPPPAGEGDVDAEFEEITPIVRLALPSGALVDEPATPAGGPEVLGPYVLLELLGNSPEGELRRALEVRQGGAPRPCVIRRLPRRDNPQEDPRVQRFLEEARVGKNLFHPHLVQVLDFGLLDGTPYLARELVDGLSLRALEAAWGEASLAVAAIAGLGFELAETLAYAHGQTDDLGNSLGLVHAEICPSNILITRDGMVKLTEVSVSIAPDGRRLKPGLEARRGRLGYRAPEQLQGRRADVKTDMFALGVVLAELLSGRPLMWDGRLALDDLPTVVRAQCQGRPDVPARMSSLLVEMTALDSRARPSSTEVTEGLWQVLSGLGEWQTLRGQIRMLLAQAAAHAMELAARRGAHDADGQFAPPLSPPPIGVLPPAALRGGTPVPALPSGPIRPPGDPLGRAPTEIVRRVSGGNGPLTSKPSAGTPRVDRRRARRRGVSSFIAPGAEASKVTVETPTLGPCPVRVLKSRPHGHVVAVLGAMARLGLIDAIEPERSRRRSLIVALIASRVLDPRTRVGAPEGVRQLVETTSLSDVLGLSSLSAEEIEGALDWLVEHGKEIRARLFDHHKGDGNLVLYKIGPVHVPSADRAALEALSEEDGTTTTSLGRVFVIGLWCNFDGRPVAIELIDPDLAEKGALFMRAEKLQAKLHIDRVVIAGDRRAVAYPARDAAPVALEAKPRPERMVPLKKKDLQKLLDAGLVPKGGWPERGTLEFIDADRPKERILIWWNPAVASEEAHLRAVRLSSTEKALDEVIAQTGRPGKKPLGADRLGARAARIFERFGTSNYFHVTIAGAGFRYSRDEDTLARRAAVDGLEAVKTTSDAVEIGVAGRLVERWKVLQREFRHRVSEDWRAERVGAHALLTVLALAVEHQLRRDLEPLISGEAPSPFETRVGTPTSSPPPAEDTASGAPAHTLRTLLADLATISQVRLEPTTSDPADGEVFFDETTAPTELQRDALARLGVELGGTEKKEPPAPEPTASALDT